jgi:protocatechuate 3,4-dioxygenase, alpha subunit
MTPTPFALSYLPETPSQTAGPYVHIGLIPNQAGFEIFENNFSGDIAGSDVVGERITIEGQIFDGAGHVTKDVLIETWQANAAGRYNHPTDRQNNKALDQNFRGWARTGTDFTTGLYTIRTIKPGSVVGRKGRKAMAPHVNFWLASRGINIGLATRMYFGDEEAANSQDPVLNIIEQPERRQTLIGRRSERGGAIVYTFDIYLQGDRETVFFDV